MDAFEKKKWKNIDSQDKVLSFEKRGEDKRSAEGITWMNQCHQET